MTEKHHGRTWRTLVGLVRRGVAFELGLYGSLYRWVFRRPVAPDGAEAFGYVGVLEPLGARGCDPISAA